MLCSTSDKLCTRILAFDASKRNTEFGVGDLNLSVESNAFIGESTIDEQASLASLTVSQTHSGSHSLSDEIRFDAITFATEEVSASTTNRRDDSDTLVSEAEVNTNIFAAEVYCICDGTASDDDDLSDNDSPRPTFIVIPGESEEDPPRTYRFIYELGQYRGWRVSQLRQSRIRSARKSSVGFKQPKPSRLNANAQHRRAYRARMAYLERLVEAAHCLGRLATATNFEEDLWPELKRVLGLE